ncbi:hypothetical protein, partial [Ralstonia holmesii]|uniref:hypothetical protein n=1 Tax=Ralstonia holmesii TaxID=3058602 RepID=UPI003F6D14D7
MAKDSLNLCRREGKGKTRCAQTVSLPFSSLQQKFKAPSKAGKSKAKPSQRQPKRQRPTARLGWPFSFDVEPLMAPWIFVAGRIKEGALSERSEFGSFPSPRHKSKEAFAI